VLTLVLSLTQTAASQEAMVQGHGQCDPPMMDSMGVANSGAANPVLFSWLSAFGNLPLPGRSGRCPGVVRC
jgi:hypothetical protein